MSFCITSDAILGLFVTYCTLLATVIHNSQVKWLSSFLTLEQQRLDALDPSLTTHHA